MRSLRHPLAVALLVALLSTGRAPSADAVTRETVMVRAKAYAFHPWTCTAANLTASCDAGYQSIYVPGDYMGLPYDWGGYMTLFQFDQEISQGYGAGSYESDGSLGCTSGVDCSGYVTSVWASGHYGTATISTVSSTIAQANLLPGDALNYPNFHVVLFSHLLGTGEPVLYEANGYNVHVNTTGGWSFVSGYTPIRYDGITGTTVGNPLGTPENPIVIGSFPYSDSRDTTQSSSDVLDGCGAAPATGESGPEYIYQVTFTQPGQLTVAVSDDMGVDIDVHLYTSMNTGDCVARNDVSFTHPVDCGTYYVVADTYSSGSTTYPGPYQLTVDFTPSGQPCGSGPPTYDFVGEPGDPCAYPGHEDLPWCNEYLGSETCLYSTADQISFCSISCTSAAQCGAFPGGCCEDIGSGELYCLEAAFCSEPPTPDAGVPDATVQPGDDGGSALDAQAGSDAAGPDGGVIVGPDAGGAPPVEDDAGCSCRTPGSGGAPALPLLLLCLLWLGWRARRSG